MIGAFTDRLFPGDRFSPNFPLVLWFTGLWFYLKSFLYFCWLYNHGLEPQAYLPDMHMETMAVVEVVYYAVTMIPSFFLGYLLWNKREAFYAPALLFLMVDTPFLLVHVSRLWRLGYLDSGLTLAVEFMGLLLNVVCLGWMAGYLVQRRTARQQ